MFVLDEEKRLKIAVNRLLRAREEKGVLAKGVYTTIAKNSGVGVRALKHEKTLHEGDDGEFEIKLASGSRYVGCDSGRIWLMTSEFGCDVEVHSGFSGHIVLRKGDADLYNDIEGDYACEK